MSDNNHSKLKRKIAIYTLIFVLAGVAARIAYVNITAEKPIIEYYSGERMGRIKWKLYSLVGRKYGRV